MNRESGYYRVKLKGNWTIAEYVKEFEEWYICGREDSISIFAFDEINETPINPQP